MRTDETARRGDGDGDGLTEAVAAVEAIVESLLGTPRRHGLQPILDTVVTCALRTVPGTGNATVLLLDRHQRAAGRAASDPAVAELDDLQLALGEGPTLEAARRSALVAEDDLARTTAWPRWARHAARRGHTAVLAVPLRGERTAGALALYRAAPEPALDEPRARLVACAATMTLEHAAEVSGLACALETRDLIGQAKGVLVERLGLDGDEAFALLVEASQATNVKLRDVAAWLARSAAGTGTEAGSVRVAG